MDTLGSIPYTDPDGPTMSFRIEHKSQREKVSVKLIEGALALAAAQGYGSLSLRSVAREAGIAPTSFYRHFRDMDELGLAMAHMAEAELLDGMKEAVARLAQRPVKPDLPGLESFLRAFGESFFRILEKNEDLFLFYFREWAGASPVIREAVGLGIDRACRLLAPALE